MRENELEVVDRKREPHAEHDEAQKRGNPSCQRFVEVRGDIGQDGGDEHPEGERLVEELTDCCQRFHFLNL